MRPTLLLSPLVPWLLLLASCSAPPKPPTVDESRKRPANTAMAVELQACQSELKNARLSTLDAQRHAERAAATSAAVQSIASLREALARLDSASLPAARPNALATIHFDHGSTRVDVPPGIAHQLLAEAKAAPLILLRGRTDGQFDVPAESRIARARAAAVADYLIAAGISPRQIRATYQPAGDHAAENLSAQGRAMNRRVEIEIYRTLPVALAATGTPSTSAP
ncbi:MAG: OmpA family protein [Roseateles asaccharophilus]|uniref:OmpA family protein n=1 Tax=Roseateles asaccharophilus TaxID=582607 RepID=UPI00391B9E5F